MARDADPDPASAICAGCTGLIKSSGPEGNPGSTCFSCARALNAVDTINPETVVVGNNPGGRSALVIGSGQSMRCHREQRIG